MRAQVPLRKCTRVVVFLLVVVATVWPIRNNGTSLQGFALMEGIVVKSPTTGTPTTSSPATTAPTTSDPTTAAPTTASPTTGTPTTSSPTTGAPTTHAVVKSKEADPDCTLNDLWCPPPSPHCYQHRNNWSACAGDHLPYRSASETELKARKTMCLYEPFCWLQLDWKREDPPLLNCTHSQQQFSFMDWSLHDGVMASLTSALRETFKMKAVFNCNFKNSRASSRNYHYDFINCPSPPKIMQNSWKSWPTSKEKNAAAQSFYEYSKLDPLGSSIEVHAVGFVSSLFEVLMAMNRTVLLNLNHRADMFRCSPTASQDTFRNLRRLASSGPTGAFPSGPVHIVAPQYLHDTEYIHHYTGIRPILLPFSLGSIMPKEPYKGTKNNTFIWNALMGIPPALKHSAFEFWSPSHYQLTDLLQYRAVIHMPYSTTNTKILEQYEMNIPIFAPTPKYAMKLKLFDDRAATGTPYCPNMNDSEHAVAHASSPYEYSPNARGYSRQADELFWIQFAEIYRWPCIEYFVSWQDLLDKLQNHTHADYLSKSRCMKQANKWRKYEYDSNLCWVFEQLAIPMNQVRNRTLGPKSTYQQTLKDLYGTEELFTPPNLSLVSKVWQFLQNVRFFRNL